MSDKIGLFLKDDFIEEYRKYFKGRFNKNPSSNDFYQQWLHQPHSQVAHSNLPSIRRDPLPSIARITFPHAPSPRQKIQCVAAAMITDFCPLKSSINSRKYSLLEVTLDFGSGQVFKAIETEKTSLPHNMPFPIGSKVVLLDFELIYDVIQLTSTNIIFLGGIIKSETDKFYEKYKPMIIQTLTEEQDNQHIQEVLIRKPFVTTLSEAEKSVENFKKSIF